MSIIPKWMEATDEGTWQGHLLAGLLCFWPGYLLGSVVLGLPGALAGAAGILTGFWGVFALFSYREGTNFRDAAKKLGARLAFKRKGLDGFMDWTMPIFGVGACINLVTGTLYDFLATLVAAELVWLGAASFNRRGDLKSLFKGESV